MKKAKIECVFPTSKDVDWVCQSIGGRHPGGPKGWWKQYKDTLKFKDVARLVIILWEAGRIKAYRLRR